MTGHHDFLVVWLPDGRNLPKKFVTKTSVKWTSRSGNVHVFAWAIDENETVTENLHKPLKGPIFCGTPVSRKFGISPRKLVSLNDFESLAGPFAVLTGFGTGAIEVVSDPWNLQPVFWHKSPSAQICGTRADLVALAADRLESAPLSFNFDCIRTMMLLSQAEGAQTAFKKTFLIPYAHKVTIKRSGMTSDRFWAPDWKAEPRTKAESKDVIAQIMDGQINALKNLVRRSSHPLEVDLTGGKDSRTMLAMCHKGGILKDVQFLTQGVENMPDVILGSHIAKKLDLNYVITDWLPALNDWETETRLRALEGFGRRGSFEEALPRPGKSWSIKGFLGETWRTCYPNRREPKNMDIVRKFHRSRFNFRKPYIRKDALEEAIQNSEARVSKRFERWKKVEDISEIEYTVQHQKVYYSGRIRGFDRVFLPLYAPRANALAYGLGLSVRREGWIMDQAYKYCGLSVDVPFTKQIEKDDRLTLKPVEKYFAHGSRSLQSEKDRWDILEKTPHKDLNNLDRYAFLKEFLLSDPGHQIYDLADYGAIEKSLAQPIGFNLKLSKLLTQLAAGKMWIDQFDEMLAIKGRYFRT